MGTGRQPLGRKSECEAVNTGQPASNNGVRSGDVWLVEGDFAQLMALFAAWRADIDSEPFAYSDEELLRAASWSACSVDHRSSPPFTLDG